MRIELIMHEGRTTGWNIIAETVEDKLVLGSMRQVEFWGTGDNLIQYDGMRTDPEDDNYVIQLQYATKAQKERNKAELFKLETKPFKSLENEKGD